MINLSHVFRVLRFCDLDRGSQVSSFLTYIFLLCTDKCQTKSKSFMLVQTSHPFHEILSYVSAK